MKKIILSLVLLFNWHSLVFAQSIGIGTGLPDNSSILELQSTSKGILIPRMTQEQRLKIQSPAQGLLVYQANIDTGFYFFEGTQWRAMDNSKTPSLKQLNKILFFIQYSNSGSLFNEYWIINTDGSSPIKIPITIPNGMKVGPNNAKLTPDGVKLIFTLSDSTNKFYIYSCALDGSNMTKLAEGNSGQYYHIEGAY